MTTDSPFTSGPEITVEETFTPAHVFRLRDELANTLLARTACTSSSAEQAAETLLTDGLINLTTLNRNLLAGETPEECDNGSCDGPKHHHHGTDCGPLCACGKGE